MANNPPFDDADAKIIPFRLPGSGSGRKRPHTGTTQHMQPSEGQSIKARGGLFYEFGLQDAPQRTRDEEMIAAAWKRLLDMMAQGKLPEPAADYQLEQISYNPRFMGLNGGQQAVLAVEQVPSGPRSGSIIAFAPAAETLEHAVRCLAHELYRFHPSQGQDDDRCYQYAQSAVRILNGGKYAGPDVNEGLEAEEQEQPEPERVQVKEASAEAASNWLARGRREARIKKRGDQNKANSQTDAAHRESYQTRDEAIGALFKLSQQLHESWNSDYARSKISGGGSEFAHKAVGGYVYSVDIPLTRLTYRITLPDIRQPVGSLAGFSAATADQFDLFGNWGGVTAKVALVVYAPRSHSQPKYTAQSARILGVDIYVMREDNQIEVYELSKRTSEKGGPDR